ncbi:MAG: hypothetical protein GY874_13930 [Desulfobacteraceae bacterium]|nr:hypothetical protein [Desulfobacteraceae bacterium]
MKNLLKKISIIFAITAIFAVSVASAGDYYHHRGEKIDAQRFQEIETGGDL